MSRYVDLDERVTAQFYDQEYEEWTMRTVTIKDVLDRVCDDYTVLSSAPPEYEELTQAEVVSEIARGSVIFAWYWLDVMTQLKQMGYAICRKR